MISVLVSVQHSLNELKICVLFFVDILTAKLFAKLLQIFMCLIIILFIFLID